MIEEQEEQEEEIHLTALSWLRSSNSSTTTFLEAQNHEQKLPDGLEVKLEHIGFTGFHWFHWLHWFDWFQSQLVLVSWPGFNLLPTANASCVLLDQFGSSGLVRAAGT